MATYRSIITNAGASLLSYQLAHGGSVNIYRAAAGNGIPSGDPRQLTTLVSEQPSLNIDLGAKQFIDGNPSVVIIPVQINNAGITVPTAIREIGLFAEDPNGEEILFAYSYIDGADTDNILPPPQVTNPEQQFDTVHTHDIILFITSDENAVISVTYTPSNFVSQSQLVEVTDGLQSNINSHASSKQAHSILGSYYIAKTSRPDQLPTWGDIQEKPSAFTPSAHAISHKSGGSDAITPADIGAETPSGAQAKVDAHAADSMPHRTTDPTTGKVYHWGLAVQNGEWGIIYEEVV